MEIFLLIADNIDDQFHALRMAIPKLLGFLFALTVFASIVFAIMRWPWVMASAVLLVAVIFAARAIPRDQLGMRFKTDP